MHKFSYLSAGHRRRLCVLALNRHTCLLEPSGLVCRSRRRSYHPLRPQGCTLLIHAVRMPSLFTRLLVPRNAKDFGMETYTIRLPRVYLDTRKPCKATFPSMFILRVGVYGFASRFPAISPLQHNLRRPLHVVLSASGNVGPRAGLAFPQFALQTRTALATCCAQPMLA